MPHDSTPSSLTVEKRALRSASLIDLQSAVQRGGFPVWRAQQVFRWIYCNDARSFDEMTNVPEGVRSYLEQHFRWGGVSEMAAERRSADGTVKFLFTLEDRAAIESVLMPEENHYTLCVSTQVGCPLQCSFCLTGLGGFQRNLRADEIVDQLLFARRCLKQTSETRPLRNLVFMGMGEPLLNVEEVIAALKLITRPDGVGFSPRRITVSTVGLVPGMKQLGDSGLGVGLAVSLNATTDSVRRQLMPIDQRCPIDDVLEACRRYPLTHRRRITFEYVMIQGINDSMEDARRLVHLLHGIPSKINLIPFNETPAFTYRRPSDSTIEAFREFLASKYFTATVRYSKGLDIEAACGQLAGTRLRKVDVLP